MFTPSQGLLTLLCQGEAGGAQETQRAQSWFSWAQLSQGIFQSMWCHFNQWNWEDLIRWQILLRDWLGLSQQVMSNCIMHHLFYIFFHCYYIFTFLSCPSKLCLSHPTSFTFCFCQFSPWSLSERVNEQLCGFQLCFRLNHSKLLQHLLGNSTDPRPSRKGCICAANMWDLAFDGHKSLLYVLHLPMDPDYICVLS